LWIHGTLRDITAAHPEGQAASEVPHFVCMMDSNKFTYVICSANSHLHPTKSSHVFTTGSSAVTAPRCYIHRLSMLYPMMWLCQSAFLLQLKGCNIVLSSSSDFLLMINQTGPGAGLFVATRAPHHSTKSAKDYLSINNIGNRVAFRGVCVCVCVCVCVVCMCVCGCVCACVWRGRLD